MTAADMIGMRNLTDALRGKTQRGELMPRFSGFAIFGATQMLSYHDPSVVIQGITEIFPSIAEDCPDMMMLGLVANFRNFFRSRDPLLASKLILTVEKGKGLITTVHPDVDSVLMLQPSPDREEPWDDEYKETFKIVRTLHERHWKSLLIVYNGGTVTRREADLWAEWSLREPGQWPVLLIKDSGRTADELASDAKFLDAHPDVHVAENDVRAINDKLLELDAVVLRQGTKDPEFLPFRPVLDEGRRVTGGDSNAKSAVG